VVFELIAREARAVVKAAELGARLREARFVHMRYVGLGNEIVTELPTRPLGADDRALLQTAFDDTYRSLYGRLVPRLDVEALSGGLVFASEAEPVRPADQPPEPSVAVPLGRLRLFDPEALGPIEAAVYGRAGLATGAELEGTGGDHRAEPVSQG
jgi:N-methylhydantoinase A/oxoprolinase/acetone carboxylase beta subunit